MELAVAADVAIDLATKDDLDHHHQNIKQMFQRPAGRYYPISGSTQTTSGFSGSGPIAAAFNPLSPPPGRQWFLQWLAVWVGTSLFAVSTANLFAALCIGQSPTGPGGPSARAVNVNDSDVAQPGQNIPTAINLPDKLIVRPQTQLYVLIGGSGLAASTIYNANVGLIDVPDTDEALFW